MNEKIDINKSIDLSEIFSVLWAKKNLLIFTIFLTAVLSSLYTLSLPNIYQSTATLALTEETSGNLNSLSSQVSSLANVAGLSLTEKKADKASIAIEIIESEDFFSQLISDEIIFMKISAVKGWNQSKDILVYDSKIYDKKSNKWVSDSPFSFQGKPSVQSSHIKFLNDNFNILKDDDTGLIEVSFRHFSPSVSKEILQRIISEINSTLKEKDIKTAENSISFLKKELETTNLGELKIAINRLIAKQIEIIALANASPEYYFKILSSPTKPEKKFSPNRSFTVILSCIFVFFITSFFFLYRDLSRK
tara:strand:+ start:53 stop:970 length:918 start_codon:yes stop_codon:yes gene_type:complete